MNAIVVVDKNWAIGHENDLLFSLPGDMKHFRTLTTGGTVIMGRKTLDSFPEGKPLPNRRNIVITRNEDFQREGCEIVGSPEAALELAAGTEDERLWIIGGGSVYTAFLSRCKRVFHRNRVLFSVLHAFDATNRVGMSLADALPPERVILTTG